MRVIEYKFNFKKTFLIMFCPSKMNGLRKQNTTVGCTPGVSTYLSLLKYIIKVSFRRFVVSSPLK